MLSHFALLDAAVTQAPAPEAAAAAGLAPMDFVIYGV